MVFTKKFCFQNFSARVCLRLLNRFHGNRVKCLKRLAEDVRIVEVNLFKEEKRCVFLMN